MLFGNYFTLYSHTTWSAQPTTNTKGFFLCSAILNLFKFYDSYTTTLKCLTVLTIFINFFLSWIRKDMRIRWKRSMLSRDLSVCVKICSLFYTLVFVCLCSFIWFDFHSLNIDLHYFLERLRLLLKELFTFVYCFVRIFCF